MEMVDNVRAKESEDQVCSIEPEVDAKLVDRLCDTHTIKSGNKILSFFELA